MKNADKPIYPNVSSIENNDGQLCAVFTENQKEGLTKREYFAGLAMASFFGGEYIGQSGMPEQEIAKRCVAMADALLMELSNGDGQ